MIKFLKRPYPFLFSAKRNLIIALSIGFISFFLNSMRLTESFVNQYLLIPKLQISIIVGIIVFLCIIIVLQVFPKLFIPEKTKDSWTIFKELALISMLISLIIISNYLFFIIISKNASYFLSIKFLLKVMFYAFSTGIAVSIFIIWINYTIILKENLRQSLLHNKKLQEKIIRRHNISDDFLINIPSNIQTENISFNLKQLLFIKSDGNYIEVYLKIDDKIKTKLYRASIQFIEENLKNYPFIIRAHRTYIVNVKNIIQTKGNARNYQLFFEGVKISVPVARSRFAKFNEALNANS